MTALPRRQLNRIARERAFLDAALRCFAANGYSGTTMDQVAAAAGLTKPTLYQYFPSKEVLFARMMLEKRNAMLQAFAAPGSGEMVQQLHGFAWSYTDTVMQPMMLSLARLILAEVQRFPEIGRVYQAAGPDQLLSALTGFLETQRAAGRLAFDDAELAAEDLWGLILSAPRTKALYHPDLALGRETLARYVTNGLQVFLRAYSTDPEADLARLALLKTPKAAEVIHDA
ncbi:MAG: TetR/AcrR family transcriptional regulator [Tabrizicola sp.]|nr:TetR/AcrR family transcriptional regulator [Tabrizicola sp.]